MLFKYRDSSLAAPLLMQMQSAPFHVLSLIDTSNSNNVEEEIENVRLSVLIVKDIAHVSFGLFPLDGWPSWEQKETAFDIPKIIPSNAWQERGTTNIRSPYLCFTKWA